MLLLWITKNVQWDISMLSIICIYYLDFPLTVWNKGFVHLFLITRIVDHHSYAKRRIHQHIKCSDSRLTALMNSRAELISVSYQQQPHVNSKGSSCSKVSKCIIYALVDLIETENVMFHSSTLLMSRQSPTNVVALLQAPSAPGPRLVGQIRQRGEALISTWLNLHKEAEVQH